VQAVNTTLIELYWQIGEHISRKIAASEWGDGVVDQLARYLAQTQPGLRGFTRRNLFRMRQFYEAYAGNELVSPLVTQLPWTHHLIILSQSKRAEEQAFYVRLAVQEKWSKRQLERQFKAALFERTVLTPAKVSAVLSDAHPEAASVFKDSYLIEFLDLPQGHAETDLHRGLLLRLKDFLIELGRDFCFVGSEYPVQVGGRDFALDLLFFHRGLNSLVAIELKVGTLRAGIPGQAEFLSGSPGPGREEVARTPGHRPVAVREQRRRGGRVRPEPQHLACVDRRISDPTAGQGFAAGEAA
jgi:predicted nuclease of restriction endonuclease-like (RecB) superfamily